MYILKSSHVSEFVVVTSTLVENGLYRATGNCVDLCAFDGTWIIIVIICYNCKMNLIITRFQIYSFFQKVRGGFFKTSHLSNLLLIRLNSRSALLAALHFLHTLSSAPLFCHFSVHQRTKISTSRMTKTPLFYLITDAKLGIICLNFFYL
jgi:hypothetical protein